MSLVPYAGFTPCAAWQEVGRHMSDSRWSDPNRTYKVVLCCGDGLLRDALANWIASLPGYEIAGELGISPPTVTNHKRRIFAKLEVQSRTQATAEVGRLGMRLPGQPIGRNGDTPQNLTRREREILDSIARGESVRQTAQALG